MAADGFRQLVNELAAGLVRYVVIGVWGANYWARHSGLVFTTEDRDLLLPADPVNMVRAWRACEAAGFSLWSGAEPLDYPRDELVAKAVCAHRALVRATDSSELIVDLTLVMGHLDFESVWQQRRVFIVEGLEIPVASLAHIVESKAAAGRPKDRLFLATHEEALRELLGHERK